MCFLWNNLWSVCRYVMGPFSGWWKLGGSGLWYLTAPFEEVYQKSVITDSHFSWNCFQMTDFLHKSDKTVLSVSAYKGFDLPDDVQFAKRREKYVASLDYTGLTENCVSNADPQALLIGYEDNSSLDMYLEMGQDCVNNSQTWALAIIFSLATRVS